DDDGRPDYDDWQCFANATCADDIACTRDVCQDGVCFNPPWNAGTGCIGGVCDGNGTEDSCVECVQDVHCPQERPWCDGETNTCFKCVSDSDCGPETPVCDVAAGRCIGCSSDADCSVGHPLCDPTTTACVACLDDQGCDDGNECTEDVCEANGCVNPPMEAGASCSTGVCTGGDDASCRGCEDVSSGADPDLGCSIDAPFCDSV